MLCGLKCYGQSNVAMRVICYLILEAGINLATSVERHRTPSEFNVGEDCRSHLLSKS